jgi:hypothetical protein
MDSNTDLLFQELYKNFNERRIDLVIAQMTKDVKWANGMDGGYVYGRKGVEEYWTRQFKMINSKVTPIEIREEQGRVILKIHQVVHDLNGNLLANEMTEHIFYLNDGQISEFHIKQQ